LSITRQALGPAAVIYAPWQAGVMDDEAGEPIGACLRRYREAAGLSLAGLARLVNYCRGYLGLFLRLIAVRDAVRTGARLDSAGYHLVYHPFSEALWRFRLALRACFGEDPFTPRSLGRADWSNRERCTGCGPGPDGAP
jgi:hypothetical protein